MIQSNKRHVVRSDRPAPPATTAPSDAQPAVEETSAPQTYVNQTRENDKKFFANIGKHRPAPQNKGPLQLVPTFYGSGFVSAGLREDDPFKDLSPAERELVEAALAPFTNRKAPTVEENVIAENVEAVEAQEATGEAQSLTVAVNEAAKPVAAKKSRGPSKKKKPEIVEAGEEGDELNTEEIVIEDHVNVREVLGSGFGLVARVEDYEHSM